jgi:cytochrome c-type biogenesis protein CcsB
MRRAWMAIVALAASWLLAGPALAQNAPAGNAHPETQVVSAGAESLANPFGAPGSQAALSAERRESLARGVDLSPLRRAAVFHDGRVKILDTLARETVARIAGRKAYQDVLSPDGGGKPRKVEYDPLFTLLDLVIDPAYYADRPLVHVEYLPLRAKILELALPARAGESAEEANSRQAAIDRWMKLTRLAPTMVERAAPMLDRAISDLPADAQTPMRKAMFRVFDAVDLCRGSAANMLLVAPEKSEDEYRHLSTLPEDHPARRAAAELGASWRAGDAAGVNAAAGSLASALEAISPAVYPTGRRDIEYAYNQANAFEWGYWMYALALLALILAFGTGRRWLVGIGVATLAAAVSLHGFGFVTRCIIAERFAIQNQFESMTGLSLFACIVGGAIMLLKRQWLYGAAAAGVGFLVLVTATQTAIPGRFIEREAAILNTSVLLKYHVTTVLCSYGLISLGFIVSLFYLGTHYAAKLRRGGPAVAGLPRQPLAERGAVEPGSAQAVAVTALNLEPGKPTGIVRTLHDLDRAQMTVLQLAFWTLGVGILLGAWWADHSWGRWWNFDPKETWALATWIIYLIVIHIRFTTGHNRGLVTAWLSVLGFMMMLWTYFGVNLLLPGLHAYA